METIDTFKLDWDQVIADKVAAKVLAAIGDQMKMPEDMAAWCKSVHTGNDWAYSYPFGWGIMPMRVDVYGKSDSLRFMFVSANNQQLMEFTLHA
jgi:hypothetical protein